MIEIKDIAFSYPDGDILKGVGFTAERGEVVGLLGNNVAGKSTFVTCLNRIRKPKSGSLTIDGKNAFQMSRNELARTVSYVAQKNEMTHSTVFDCVLLGRKPYITWSVSQEDLDICTRIMERVGLLDLQMRYVDELSGGELQKVMLARALAQQPKVLLLDEPTSALDIQNQYQVLKLVREFCHKDNMIAAVVIHDLNLALRFCDRFLLLKDGQVYRHGDRRILDSEALREVYGVDAKVVEIESRHMVLVEE